MFTIEIDVCSPRVVNCGFQRRLLDLIITEVNPLTMNDEPPGSSLKIRDTGEILFLVKGQINRALTERQNERQNAESCFFGQCKLTIQRAGQK